MTKHLHRDLSTTNQKNRPFAITMLLFFAPISLLKPQKRVKSGCWKSRKREKSGVGSLENVRNGW